jgi:hypothetical protein
MSYTCTAEAARLTEHLGWRCSPANVFVTFRNPFHLAN